MRMRYINPHLTFDIVLQVEVVFFTLVIVKLVKIDRLIITV